ncbi:MAG: Flp pilus assembly protein TadG [Hyphomicrobiaceae bacterium]|jgi:Flp pilus assembly protein TadG
MRSFGQLIFGQQRLKRLSGFRKDARGVAAIEFAMIVPLMFMMFVGTVEFSQAITIDRRVSQVAGATADLIARAKTVSTSDMTGIMQVVEQLIKPYDHTLLKMSVMNVAASPTDATDTKVCWAYAHNGGAGNYSKDDSYALPPGVVAAGDSVIVTEVKYAYEPLIFSHFITTTKDLTEKFYLKPRLSSYVEYDGNDCS